MCLKGTQLWISLPTLTTNVSASDIHIHCISYSYITSTGASEKYFSNHFSCDQSGYSGRTLPNARRQARGVFTASVSWPVSFFNYLCWESLSLLSILSSIPRYYIGWNQIPFTSRCLMSVAGWSSANSILVKKFSQGGLILRTFSLVGRPGPSPGVPDEVPPEMLTAFCSWGWAGNLIHSCPGESPIHMWKMPSLDPTTLGSTIFYVYSAPIRGKPLLDIPSHTLVFRMTINP